MCDIWLPGRHSLEINVRTSGGIRGDDFCAYPSPNLDLITFMKERVNLRNRTDCFAPNFSFAWQFNRMKDLHVDQDFLYLSSGVIICCNQGLLCAVHSYQCAIQYSSIRDQYPSTIHKGENQRWLNIENFTLQTTSDCRLKRIIRKRLSLLLPVSTNVLYWFALVSERFTREVIYRNIRSMFWTVATARLMCVL